MSAAEYLRLAGERPSFVETVRGLRARLAVVGLGIADEDFRGLRATPHPGLMRRLEAHEGELATCAIVWHELVFGASRLPRGRKRHAIEAYLDEAVRAALPILPYDEAAAGWHARERARLSRSGSPPSAADGQIAAITAVNELVLVTSNLRDFQRFQSLRVEDWRRS